MFLVYLNNVFGYTVIFCCKFDRNIILCIIYEFGRNTISYNIYKFDRKIILYLIYYLIYYVTNYSV